MKVRRNEECSFDKSHMLEQLQSCLIKKRIGSLLPLIVIIPVLAITDFWLRRAPARDQRVLVAVWHCAPGHASKSNVCGARVGTRVHPGSHSVPITSEHITPVAQ